MNSDARDVRGRLVGAKPVKCAATAASSRGHGSTHQIEKLSCERKKLRTLLANPQLFSVIDGHRPAQIAKEG